MEGLIENFKKWRTTLLTLFIVFNITAVFLGCTQIIHVPLEIRKIFYPYLRWTRIAQSWYLFAPEPKRVALKYKVEIIFKDQTRTYWSRPYPGKWNFFERHEAYQFQKFDLGANYLMKDPDAQRDFCSYAMRLNWSEENPPETVTLYQERADWPAPRADRELNYDESQLRWSDHMIATYRVNGRVLE